MCSHQNKTKSILLVCMGNCCRSPLAQGLMEHALGQTNFKNEIRVDSAGLGDWHVGEGTDERAFLVAENYGIDLSDHVVRKITREDFHNFDVILGMDREIVDQMIRLKPETTTAKIDLFLNHMMGVDEDIVDPYMHGEDVFHNVFMKLQEAVTVFLQRLVR